MKNDREVRTTRQGFVRLIILIVIALILLGYFGVNLKDVLASPVVKENLSYAWELAKDLWTNWLRGPVVWVWDHVLRFLWELFLNGIEGIRNGGGPSELMEG